MPSLGPTYQNPTARICQRILNEAPFNREFAELPEMPLDQFLWLARPGLDGKTLVIFLDRFEDFFIHFTPENRAAFITELARCYHEESLPVKFILSIRKEYFSDLYELEALNLPIFYNHLKLEPLNAAQAYQAISTPADRLGLLYEEGLPEIILNDLSGTHPIS